MSLLYSKGILEYMEVLKFFRKSVASICKTLPGTRCKRLRARTSYILELGLNFGQKLGPEVLKRVPREFWERVRIRRPQKPL